MGYLHILCLEYEKYIHSYLLKNDNVRMANAVRSHCGWVPWNTITPLCPIRFCRSSRQLWREGELLFSDLMWEKEYYNISIVTLVGENSDVYNISLSRSDDRYNIYYVCYYYIIEVQMKHILNAPTFLVTLGKAKCFFTCAYYYQSKDIR